MSRVGVVSIDICSIGRSKRVVIGILRVPCVCPFPGATMIRLSLVWSISGKRREARSEMLRVVVICEPLQRLRPQVPCTNPSMSRIAIANVHLRDAVGTVIHVHDRT